MNDPKPAGDELDREAFEPGFGPGGVPLPLLLFYLSFLVFFTWYVLEYQLPDYLELRAEGAPAQEGVAVPGATESDGEH